MHLLNFVDYAALVTGLLFVCGLCGWSAISPFQDQIRYSSLLAPLSGILILSLSTLALYVFLKITLQHAACLALAITAIISIISLFVNKPAAPIRLDSCQLIASISIISITVWFTMASSIRLGQPTLLFVDGTDQLGYAHLADWLVDHRVSELPQTNPTRPYESWPAFLFQVDPRFGSFTFLGLISLVTGESGMFSYDIATAIVFSAVIMAVAGVFSCSRLSLLLLIIGLFTTHWFDYGRTGFFGKLLGYPSAFFIAGIFMSTAGRIPFTIPMTASMITLAAAAALMHSGIATGFFVGILCVTFLLYQFIFASDRLQKLRQKETFNLFLILSLAVGVATMSSGTLARPLSLIFPKWDITWPYILPRILDFENQGTSISGFSASTLTIACTLAMICWISIAAFAVYRKSEISSALLSAPLLLFVGLYLLDAKAEIFQMIGTFYPLALCGMAVLFDNFYLKTCLNPHSAHRDKITTGAIFVLVVIAIGAHFPRLVGAIERYGGQKTRAKAVFPKSTIDQLTKIIGKETVDVELPEIHSALVILVELSRRGVSLQWTPKTWKSIFGYRDWQSPHYKNAGTFSLKLTSEQKVPRVSYAFLSPQYRLTRRSHLTK